MRVKCRRQRRVVSEMPSREKGRKGGREEKWAESDQRALAIEERVRECIRERARARRRGNEGQSQGKGMGEGNRGGERDLQANIHEIGSPQHKQPPQRPQADLLTDINRDLGMHKMPLSARLISQVHRGGRHPRRVVVDQLGRRPACDTPSPSCTTTGTRRYARP